MRSREARLSKCCGVRGSGALPVAAEAAAETREEADGEVRPHSTTQRTQVAVHEVGIVKCQNVVDTSGGKLSECEGGGEDYYPTERSRAFLCPEGPLRPLQRGNK